jgi:phytoene dehydrogenase-like protein
MIWRRTPADLAAEFPGSRGAIYGAASNDRFAAFKRPPNRVRGLRGLYLASGSAHPGGGLPMAGLSGLAAADCLGEDLGLSTPLPSPG